MCVCVFQILCHYRLLWVSLVAQTVKNLPAMQETRVWDDPLEKEITTHVGGCLSVSFPYKLLQDIKSVSVFLVSRSSC